MSALNEVRDGLRSMKNKINALKNNDNFREHVKLHSLFAKESVKWGKIKRELPMTRSRTLIDNQFRYLYRQMKLKFPELTMPNYMELTKMYRNNPHSVPYHAELNRKRENLITWTPHYVNNLPIDALTRTVINNGNKAIKINKSIYSRQSFRNLARTPITNVMSYHGNSILFKDPLTRKTVRRSQVEPVTIRKKNI